MKLLKMIMLMCLFVGMECGTTQFNLRWNSTIRICGSTLYNYLAIICNHEYHEYHDGSVENNLEIINISTGPVDECCKKPCKLRALKAYCMNSSIPEESSAMTTINPETRDEFKNSTTTSTQNPETVPEERVTN